MPRFGGRQKGTKNKSRTAVEETAARLKVNPFEVLCLFAKGDWKALGYEAECYFAEKPDGAVKMGYVISPEMRVTAAKEASKYLYPQKKALEVSTDETKGFKVILEDYTGKKPE